MTALDIVAKLVSDERAKSLDKNIVFYAGNLHPELSGVFLESQNKGKPIYWQHINGTPVYIDARQGNDYWVSRNGEVFKPKEAATMDVMFEGKMLTISKTKAKQLGLMKR